MKKYCHRRPIAINNTFQQQYWYWYRQYFIVKVLLLVLTISRVLLTFLLKC